MKVQVVMFKNGKQKRAYDLYGGFAIEYVMPKCKETKKRIRVNAKSPIFNAVKYGKFTVYGIFSKKEYVARRVDMD